ncbi:DMT family transporter [Bacillus chungangensis]|uniref:DMT family transporter n=1 Tax=Bacillus chungangensis TaxID=587633 RepID=UPI0027D7A475|nr:EamA family transporter [Bacillus chungangensis]
MHLPQVMVIIAALCWGFIAVFVKKLTSYGFTEMEIVTIRTTSALILTIPLVLVQKDPTILKISPKHIPYFFGTGVLSIAFFNWCYFTAMNKMSISLAVMLLYTSPAFVAILSVFFLKEHMNQRKIAAIAATIIGCSMIALAGGSTDNEWSFIGFMIGLGAGLGYALYSIFGKLALQYYESFTITFYTFVVATACLLPFFPFWKKLHGLPLEAWVYMIGLGFVPTVLAYLLYTVGLRKMESSKAAILATVEPIAAVMVGVLLFSETILLVQVIGALFILSSVVIVSNVRKPSQQWYEKRTS